VAAGEEPAELRSAWMGGGARLHTNVLHTNLADIRELHGERIRDRRLGAKGKRRAGTPGAPSVTVCGAIVAVGPEGLPALAGWRAAPPRAEYSVHA
jgi:hypothetical protein